MRFVTYEAGNCARAGVVLGGYIYPLSELLNDSKYDEMLDFIRDYGVGELPVFAPSEGMSRVLECKARLYAPVRYPGAVICLGKNYADHAREVLETKLQTQGDDMLPTAPVYFCKTARPAMGNGDVVPLHSNTTEQVDYEAELAVVIGKEIRNVKPGDVGGCIFGYTILNDITARNLQTKHGQWYLGKSLDGFCPIGPAIVGADEIRFPLELNIMCRVNGELRQNSNTKNLIYDVPRVISELSRGMTLYPGDVIATGTPAGIGHAQKPPKYLKPDDRVECEIEKIGILWNLFR